MKYYINDGKHQLIINSQSGLEACQKFIDKYKKRGSVVMLVSEIGFRDDLTDTDKETQVFTQLIT
jgi:hypothetical protein